MKHEGGEMADRLSVRQMTRAEVDDLVDQAAAEGWNPGLHDADVFWHTDPGAFVMAELHGTAIGGGSIASYDGQFGFMGFFIVRPQYRGQGYGSELWHERKRLLRQRLDPGATIGMDGVFEMQPWYARGGFAFSHRQIRFVASGPQVTSGLQVTSGRRAEGARSLVPMADVSFEIVRAYDRACFPAPRERFLRAWTTQPDSLALVAQEDQRMTGYGVIRRCREGTKIGPLFADDPASARTLFSTLASFAEGQDVYLDVPENNAAAMALASEFGMQQVFGTARMYLGTPPRLRTDRIYGNTTFELG